jgi:hypothetical protein
MPKFFLGTQSTKVVLKVSVMGVRYLSINCDKLTSIDNHHWLLIHVYVVNNWVCTPLLWSMVQVVDGSNVDNLTSCVMEFLLMDHNANLTIMGHFILQVDCDPHLELIWSYIFFLHFLWCMKWKLCFKFCANIFAKISNATKLSHKSS